MPYLSKFEEEAVDKLSYERFDRKIKEAKQALSIVATRHSMNPETKSNLWGDWQISGADHNWKFKVITPDLLRELELELHHMRYGDIPIEGEYGDRGGAFVAHALEEQTRDIPRDEFLKRAQKAIDEEFPGRGYVVNADGKVRQEHE